MLALTRGDLPKSALPRLPALLDNISKEADRNPTIVTLFELASALGVSHVDLVIPDDEARSERSKSKRK